MKSADDHEKDKNPVMLIRRKKNDFTLTHPPLSHFYSEVIISFDVELKLWKFASWLI